MECGESRCVVDRDSVHSSHPDIHIYTATTKRGCTHSRDAVGRATVDDGGSLRAVSGVGSEGLSDNVASDNTSSQGGDNSGEGETHFGLECGICSRNVPEEKFARSLGRRES